MRLLCWSGRFHIKYLPAYALRLLLIFVLIAVSSMAFFNSPVFAAPAITTTTLPDGQVNVYYSTALAAAPLTGAYTWVLTGGTLPVGLALTTTGIIYGTPTTAGTYGFSVRVTDTIGPSADQSLSITIYPPPFNISTSTLPSGKEGTAYSATLSLSGGTSPYSWTIYSGTLPSGLTLGSTTGTISGTPSANTAGSYSFTVYVADSSASILSTQKSFSLYIEEGVYEAKVTIGTGLAAGSTRVKVDGQAVATLTGGQSTDLTLDIGATRNVSVDATVEDPANAGIRYKASSETIRVSQAQPDAEFTYYTEYLVTVKTEPSVGSQPAGGGWYKKDAAVNFSTAAQIDGNTGTQYRFASWLVSGSQRGTTENFNLTVDGPITVTAKYDTYYRLSAQSAYGTVEGAGWYKAGSQARWLITNDRVAMPGLIGLFQGKFKAVNASGTETMDGPKTITVFWEPDYTLPYILIPLASLAVVLALFGIYRMMSGQQTKPQTRAVPTAAAQPPPYMPPPAPPYPQYIPQQPVPTPQPHTTVVMIGGAEEKPRQSPQSTKEQLMEKFGELLEKYENEIKATPGTRELPPAEIIPQKNMIAPPPVIPPSAVDAEYSTREDEQELCQYSTKKLLRTVSSKWKQLESSSVTLPPTGAEETKESRGVLIVWAKYIFNEWETHKCTLIPGHQGNHHGKTEVVYSLLNIIIEKKIYGPAEKELQPPTPHFTDNMPELEINNDRIVSTDDLPLQTEK